MAGYAYQAAGVFTTFANVTSANPGIVYKAATKQLGFAGPMSQQILQQLTQPLVVLEYGANGFPIVNASGHFVTDTITWAAPAAIQTLFTESQSSVPLNSIGMGYRVGGLANSISPRIRFHWATTTGSCPAAYLTHREDSAAMKI